MTKFIWKGFADKLVEQNKGVIIDAIDGCLLDSLLFYTKRGLMACVETYVNCWTSCYTCYFSTNEDEIFEIWNRLPGRMEGE